MKYTPVAGGNGLQGVADRDICVTQVADLAPFANRADEAIESESGGCNQGREQHVQLPDRIALEQLVGFERVGYGEDEDEHQACTQVC